MKYENDEREVKICEIEKILTEKFGESDRQCGCYVGGRWLSIDTILEIISDNI